MRISNSDFIIASHDGGALNLSFSFEVTGDYSQMDCEYFKLFLLPVKSMNLLHKLKVIA